MIVQANALQIPLPDNSVHCCVTSPPYWGLRKYQGEQLTDFPDGPCAFGLEPTIEQYVEHSILILREVRRVLRDDGVCWWNLGDSYSSYRDSKAMPDSLRNGNGTAVEEGANNRNPSLLRQSGLKHLDLCLIPERVALAAQADGWYVRSLVIWAKPNPMPESVSGWRWERHRVKVGGEWSRQYYNTGDGHGADIRNRPATQWADCPGCPKCSPNDGLVLRKGSWRPTDAYEHILMLAKLADYFGDAEAVREPHSRNWAGENGLLGSGDSRWAESAGRHDCERPEPPKFNPAGRNLRNVWTFPTQPYPEAHFATFPERLPEICIKASTSERGCCPKCGACWVRVVDRQQFGKVHSDTKFDATTQGGTLAGSRQAYRAAGLEGPPPPETLGWRPSCCCNAGEPVPCTVLDCFGGSGTTARVATRLNRRGISIDLAYHGLADKRTKNVQRQLVML